MFTYRYTDDSGNEVAISLSKEIHDLIDNERRFNERITEEYQKHFSDLPQEQYQALPTPDSLEDNVMLREELRRVFDVVQECTEKQRRRFLLHIVCGMTLDEIAKLERCKKQNVYSSVQQVLLKIKNNL